MERWLGKTAVVTGASSGIGAAICEKLVENGLQVAGLARRVEKVEELAKKLSGKSGKLLAFKCDVTQKEDIAKTFESIKKKLGPVHVLVNNAGLYKHGTIYEGNPEDWKTVFDTNVLGLTMCTQQAMKQMVEGNIEGHIFNINSTAGHKPLTGRPPILNVYSPSKYAVTCLGEVLREEVAHFKAKVKVTSISPGAVETDIFQTAGTKFDIKAFGPLKPSDVAGAVFYALGTPPNVEVRELSIAPFGELSLDFE